MKGILPSLAAGALVGGGLLGLLFALEPNLGLSEDPWRDAWIREGVDVEVDSIRKHPEQSFRLRDRRERFEDAEFQGSIVRNYTINGARAQVTILPSPELRVLDEDAEWEDGRTVQGSKRHRKYVSRRGRYLFVLDGQAWLWGHRRRLNDEDREKALRAFEQTAERME